MSKVSKKAVYDNDVDVSIVIPVYNERESISKLYEELSKTLSEISVNYEVLLIDDGSTDGTFDELKKIHEKNNLFKVIRFRRNFGQ
ncbi:MAG: glycosyltransferase, partial [Actinomycetota bacterium]|nr:glycosyltransferase [Actinomycetota bacterium]